MTPDTFSLKWLRRSFCLFNPESLPDKANKRGSTGATGYIGGDALCHLVEKHPEYEIASLVRNSGKGAQVASQYASVRLVYGDLDSERTLEEEAKRADIVLR